MEHEQSSQSTNVTAYIFDDGEHEFLVRVTQSGHASLATRASGKGSWSFPITPTRVEDQ